MILYLASGFSVMSNKEREEELHKKFGNWNRLVSFYFIEAWKDNILALKIEEVEKQQDNHKGILRRRFKVIE